MFTIVVKPGRGPRPSTGHRAHICPRFAGRRLQFASGRLTHDPRVSLHQANLLAGAPERSAADLTSLQAWRDGEVDLLEALELPGEVIDGLRQQALALLEAGKLARARDVVAGLAALGSVHVVDGLLFAAAAKELPVAEDRAEAAFHAARLLGAKGVIVPEEPTVPVLRALLERLPADLLASARSEWEHQRRLTSALVSFEAFTAHVVRAADSTARVERALVAAGPCAAANNFPRRAIAEAARLGRPGAARVRARSAGAKAEGRAAEPRPPRASPSTSSAPTPSAPTPSARLLALLGPGAGPALVELERSASDTQALASALSDLARLVEQSSSAPSYCVVRMGWHHARPREDYRHRRLDPTVVALSELRWSYSADAAEDGLAAATRAKDPAAALAAFVADRFFIECGFDRRRLDRAPVAPGAISRALEHELITPLRALNETIQDLDPTQVGSREDVRLLVDALMKSIARGALPSLERFWASKAGHPAGGFDVAGHVLLRSLGPGGVAERSVRSHEE